MLILVCICIVIPSKLLKPAEHVPSTSQKKKKKKTSTVISCQSTNDGYLSALHNSFLQAALEKSTQGSIKMSLSS